MIRVIFSLLLLASVNISIAYENNITPPEIPVTTNENNVPPPPPHVVTEVTQGDFAVSLLKKLGYQVTDQDRAINKLIDMKIIPGIGPDSKWEKDKKANTKFVAHIQASIQGLLKSLSLELGIPPSPTLDLFIFEMPPAPQRVTFPADKKDNGNKKDCSPKTSDFPPPVPPPLPPENLSFDDLSREFNPGNAPDIKGGGLSDKHRNFEDDKMPKEKSGENSRIDEKIVQNLEEFYEVPVIIILNIEKSDQIRSVQDSFLDSLNPADFKLKTRFDSLPGISGWITKLGLEKMKSDSRIESIKPDGLSSPTQ